MWRTPATLRGSLDDVPERPAALILALETSCDDTCAAVVTGAGEVRANVVSSQGVHDRFGGVVPEIASRHHLELVNAVVDDALGQARRDARRHRARRGHAGAGPGRRAARRRRHRQGDRRRPPAPARPGRPPAGPRRRQLPRAGPDRAAVPVPDRERRAHAARPRHRPPRLRGARPDARRRRRRGVRQGRAAARARVPGRPGAVEARGPGRPGGVRLPDRGARARARLLLRRAQDRAALHGARPGGGGDRPPRRRPRGVLRARDRRRR